MARKSESRRSDPSRFVSAAQRNVYDMPRMERPLSLICGVCGARGKYKVGTITFDPSVTDPSDREAFNEAVGFSGYFRCRKCDAGGPWKLTDEASMRVIALATLAMAGAEEGPVVFGCLNTFDKQTFRYATEAEAHLKKLIDAEPERAFLWVRLGNLYRHAGQEKLARTAYERAVELDPADIEAHGSLGQLLVDAGRSLKAVPCWHAVLKHARDARHVDSKLRRNLVRTAIEWLLEAHAESHGQIDLLPKMDPGELAKRNGDEPVVLHLHSVDLGSEKGLDDLCDMFLGRPRRRGEGLFGRPTNPVPDRSDGWAAAPIRREAVTVGRNDRCPCGSGKKYKKCCGR